MEKSKAWKKVNKWMILLVLLVFFGGMAVCSHAEDGSVIDIREITCDEDGNVFLEWKRHAGRLDGYKIYRVAEDSDRYEMVEDIKLGFFAGLKRTCSFEECCGLQHGTTYRYKVRGYKYKGNDVQYTGYSNETAVMVKNRQQKEVQDTELVLEGAAENAQNEIVLTWKKTGGYAGVSQYVIYRAVSAKGKFMPVGQVELTAEEQKEATYTYVDKSNLKKGITYTYYIRGCVLLRNGDVAYTGETKHQSIGYHLRDWEEAEKAYQLEGPGFHAIEREPELTEEGIDSYSRFQPAEDGTYVDTQEGDGCADIILTGDIMCRYGQQIATLLDRGDYYFRDHFTYVKDIFDSADFVCGNLESSIAESAPYRAEKDSIEKKPHCNAPLTFLDAIKYGGYDMLITVNNHCCDTGIRGMFETLTHIDEYGFLHTGTFKSKEEKRYVIVEIDGIKVGFLAYATYFNYKNDNWSSEGQAALINEYSKERVERDVKAARADGAEYIIAYNHWGLEYHNDTTKGQRRMAQEMADAGVDYIAGSHPHALEPYDILKAKDGRDVPVVYSMGNFVSDMTREISNDTVIFQLRLKRAAGGKVVLENDSYIPCKVLHSFEGNRYAVMPLVSPEKTSDEKRQQAYIRITDVMGKKIEAVEK